MSNRWTQNDIAFLNAKAGKETPAMIATVLGKTERAVTSYARKHGVSLAVIRKRWTPEQDQVIRDGMKQGLVVYQIAAQLGRSEKAVYHRMDVLRRVGDADS